MTIDILLSFPPLIAIFLISLFVSLVVNVVYKFATNQDALKKLQKEMKSLRKEMKAAKDQKKAMELNKQLMEKTMQQMKHSMKSTIITIVPMFIIFGWMSANLAFHSALPEEEFTASITFEKEVSGEANLTSETLRIISNSTQMVQGDKVSWTVEGGEGDHELFFNYGGESYSRKVVLTDKWEYADPYLEKENRLFGIINLGDADPIGPESSIKRVAVDLHPVRPFGDFDLFGWKPGWLAVYFVFTLLLTFPIRKLLRVH